MRAKPVLLLAVLAVGGCGGLGLFTSQRTAKLSEAELRQRLNEIAVSFANEVETTADGIVGGSDDRAVRRRALVWKIHATEASQESILLEPPMTAFIDIWTLSVQMGALFTEGAARDVFGAAQPDAVAACRRIEARIETLADDLLPGDALADVREAVHQFARENPVVALRGRVTNRPAVAGPGALAAFGSVLSIPLAPFRALEGIDEGAQAVREFTAVADRFTSIVHKLPEQTSWQMELLLYDIEDRASVKEALEALVAVGDSAASLADTARTLPEDTRRTLVETVDELADRQAELQQTLREARETIGEVRAALGPAGETSASLERMARQVAEAGAAWEATARAFGLPGDGARGGDAAAQAGASVAPAPVTDTAAAGAPAAADDEGGGFDVEALGGAARDVTGAATELRGLVDDLHVLLESDAVARLDDATRGTVDRTSERARGLVDHAAWRALQLLAVLFAGLVVLRLVPKRSG